MADLKTMCSLWWTLAMIQAVCLLVGLVEVSTAAENVKVVDYSGHKVIRVFPKTSEQLDALRTLEDEFHFGIDVWGETPASSNRSAAAVDLHVIPRVYDEVTSRLHRSSVQFDITIRDLQSVINKEKAESEEHRASIRHRRAAVVHADAEEEEEEIVGVYASHSEINDWMQTLRRRHPELVELIDIGRSYEGRPLVVIKIGQQSRSSKPAIWIDAGIHAREWIAPATAVYIINALVSGHGEDAPTSLLVANYDWFILPVVNPDGYEYSNSTDRMWRKTRSRAANGRNFGCVGVDANRNFDFHWQSECEGRRSGGRCRGRRPCDNVFAGRQPLSEPETVAVANFIMQRRSSIRLYLSLHCYSQLWLTPWGYTPTPPADNDDLMRVANRAVEALESLYNTDYALGSPAVILYAATGGSYDWAKGVAGIKYSYTIELRDRGHYGFVLPRWQIVPTAEETWAGIRAAVEEMERDQCWVRGRNCQ